MIMELLYNGRIYPHENIVSEDEGYKKAIKEMSSLYDDLYARLSEADKKQLEQIHDSMYDSQSFMEEEHFRYGFTLGVVLMQEVYGVYGAKYFKPDM